VFNASPRIPRSLPLRRNKSAEKRLTSPSARPTDGSIAHGALPRGAGDSPWRSARMCRLILRASARNIQVPESHAESPKNRSRWRPYSKTIGFFARLSEAGQTGNSPMPRRDLRRWTRAVLQNGSGQDGGQDRVSGAARRAATLMRRSGAPRWRLSKPPGDTHANQGVPTGRWRTVAGMDKAMSALADELGPLWPKPCGFVR